MKCKTNFYLLFFSLLGATSSAIAANVITVAASISSAHVRTDSSVVISYFVVNNLPIPMPASTLTIKPADRFNGNSSEVNIQNNQCSNTTLPSGGVCTFEVVVNGKNQPSQVTLHPTICAGYSCYPGAGHWDANISVVPASQTPVAYVGLSTHGMLDTINLANDTVSESLAGFDFGNLSQGVAVSTDGNKIYVANPGAHNLMIRDAQANTLTPVELPAGANPDQPAGVTVTPDGSQVYIADTANAAVYAYNTSSKQITTITSPYLTAPYGVTVNPDGSKIYVTNASNVSGNVGAMINTGNNSVVAHFDTERNTLDVTVTPDGSKFFITNNISNTVEIFNAGDALPLSYILLPEAGPHSLVFTRDDRLFVTDYLKDTVSVINIANLDQPTLLATIPVHTHPTGIALSPDGSKVYVTQNDPVNQDLAIINTSNYAVKYLSLGDAQQTIGNFIG